MICFAWSSFVLNCSLFHAIHCESPLFEPQKSAKIRTFNSIKSELVLNGTLGFWYSCRAQKKRKNVICFTSSLLESRPQIIVIFFKCVFTTVNWFDLVCCRGSCALLTLLACVWVSVKKRWKKNYPFYLAISFALVSLNGFFGSSSWFLVFRSTKRLKSDQEANLSNKKSGSGGQQPTNKLTEQTLNREQKSCSIDLVPRCNRIARNLKIVYFLNTFTR